MDTELLEKTKEEYTREVPVHWVHDKKHRLQNRKKEGTPHGRNIVNKDLARLEG